jgi:hypothetical protein
MQITVLQRKSACPETALLVYGSVGANKTNPMKAACSHKTRLAFALSFLRSAAFW